MWNSPLNHSTTLELRISLWEEEVMISSGRLTRPCWRLPFKSLASRTCYYSTYEWSKLWIYSTYQLSKCSSCPCQTACSPTNRLALQWCPVGQSSSSLQHRRAHILLVQPMHESDQQQSAHILTLLLTHLATPHLLSSSFAEGSMQGHRKLYHHRLRAAEQGHTDTDQSD